MLEIIKIILLLCIGYCAARAQMEYRKRKERQKEPKIHGYTKGELIKQGKKDVKATAKRNRRIKELKAKITAREKTLRRLSEGPISLFEDLEEWKVELEMLERPKTGCSPNG